MIHDSLKKIKMTEVPHESCATFLPIPEFENNLEEPKFQAESLLLIKVQFNLIDSFP